MPPTSVDQIVAIQHGRSAATANGKTMGVDACMIRPVLLWAWRVCMATVPDSSWADEAGLGPGLAAVQNEIVANLAEESAEVQAMGRKVKMLEREMAALKRTVEALTKKSGEECTLKSTATNLQKLFDNYKDSLPSSSTNAAARHQPFLKQQLVFPCQQLVFLKQQRVVNPSLSSSSSLLILDHSSSSVLIIDQQLITVHPELRQRPNQQRVPLLIFKQQIVID
ncbi:unnamed protein product [Tilletia controversa]|nr:unnamed protein product [Tilletia controversa]CAD6946129.1 unnamed protein product [Tilletia controversa]